MSIALNLAYLNIPKFRYISIVTTRLKARLGELPAAVKSNVKNTQWFKQLDSLASVDARELEWPTLAAKHWIKAPDLWGLLYNVFFYWRVGRLFSLISTLYALVLLALGVGYASGAVDAMATHFDQHIGLHYFWSVMSALWPIITVLTGEYVCRSAGKFVDYQTKDLEDQVIATAEATVAEADKAVDEASSPTG